MFASFTTLLVRKASVSWRTGLILSDLYVSYILMGENRGQRKGDGIGGRKGSWVRGLAEGTGGTQILWQGLWQCLWRKLRPGLRQGEGKAGGLGIPNGGRGTGMTGLGLLKVLLGLGLKLGQALVVLPFGPPLVKPNRPVPQQDEHGNTAVQIERSPLVFGVVGKEVLVGSPALQPLAAGQSRVFA